MTELTYMNKNLVCLMALCIKNYQLSITIKLNDETGTSKYMNLMLFCVTWSVNIITPTQIKDILSVKVKN